MKGDFSRDSFDRLHHYSRVLQQQGRVELDSDGNERQAIQLHLLRSLAADVIGAHGGPGTGFELADLSDNVRLKHDFVIRKGHYYVDGWLCENDADARYKAGQPGAQPWLPQPGPLEVGQRYLAYLDVWERHVSAAEVEDGDERHSQTAMREVALGGLDTTTRAQVVWQVKVSLGPANAPLPPDPITPGAWAAWMQAHWAAWRVQWEPSRRGRLKARAVERSEAESHRPCVVSPQSRYRGLENQLYRVEVHRGGAVGDALPPTFVWSRENGAVVFPIERVDGHSVKLAEGWRDDRLGVGVGDVVELSDDRLALGGMPGPLVRVKAIDLDTQTVSFEGAVAGSVDTASHAVLRRWDHGRRRGDVDARPAPNDGRPNIADDLGLVIAEERWLTMEDGIAVWFASSDAGEPRVRYRSGDYWLIPARTALGDVLWPRTADQPRLLPPQGVEHHYAPLGVVTVAGNGEVTVVGEPRLRFKTLVELTSEAAIKPA